MERGYDRIVCFMLPVFVAIVVIPMLYVLYWTGKPIRPPTSHSLRTLIVLGSGGHTAEMLRIVNVLQKDSFAPRFYIAATTDNMSLQKARVLEESLIEQGKDSRAKITEASHFMQIYRSGKLDSHI